MHIFNNNHTDKKITIKIDKIVGKPYSFLTVLAKRGIGSRRILIDSYSPGLHSYFDQDNDLRKVNFELRPEGIIVFIKNKINDYKWVIPFHALHIYNTELFSIHAHGNFLKFKSSEVFPYNKKFFDKVMAERALVMQDYEFVS